MRTQEREVPAIQALGPDTDKAQGFQSYTDTVRHRKSVVLRPGPEGGAQVRRCVHDSCIGLTSRGQRGIIRSAPSFGVVLAVVLGGPLPFG